MFTWFKRRFSRAEYRPAPAFSGPDFAAPTETCDIVMKGGVTSGIVYPYAILELATRYRFCSVGGTSAGGIAAAFAAAAEFARANNDPDGFARLEQRCLELPDKLRSLFQAEPRLQPLMGIALALSRGDGFGVAWAFVRALWLTVGVGALGTALVARGFGGDWSVMTLSGILGVLVAVGLRLSWLVFIDLKANGYGLCRGLGCDAAKPALTEWLHASLQFIAFGDTAATPPLTFGDLDGRGITLRMITTNLSLRRPHALPKMIAGVMFDPTLWKGLFPAPVMTHLLKVCRKFGPRGEYRHCPAARDMPVLMAVRMSLSFPFLISAVPMMIRDIGAEKRETARRTEQAKRLARDTGAPLVTPAPVGKLLTPMWFSDGGLTSNFPIHFFDAPLPSRPTFALSLDDLPKGETAPASRVRMQMNANEGIYLPIAPIASVGDFALSLLGAAKDWQDTLLSGMPGQRERIVRVTLTDEEGGLNLDMPAHRSTDLMGFGREAGVALKRDFKFDEHRWRRSLVVYEQLERTLEATATVWQGGHGVWLSSYAQKSYTKNVGVSRQAMEIRLNAFAALAPQFVPALRDKDGHYPKPVGRLRITPDV